MTDKNDIKERWWAKKYLVYELGQPEMGTEGGANYYGYAICVGNTIEEVMEDYKNQVKELYGVESNPKQDEYGWYNYYRLEYNELPDYMYGGAKKLNIYPELAVLIED